MGYKKLNVQRIPEDVAEEVAVERVRKDRTNDEIITDALADRYDIEWNDAWFTDEFENEGEQETGNE